MRASAPWPNTSFKSSCGIHVPILPTCAHPTAALRGATSGARDSHPIVSAASVVKFGYRSGVPVLQDGKVPRPRRFGGRLGFARRYCLRHFAFQSHYRSHLLAPRLGRFSIINWKAFPVDPGGLAAVALIGPRCDSIGDVSKRLRRVRMIDRIGPLPAAWAEPAEAVEAS